jgi:hypothetical protein
MNTVPPLSFPGNLHHAILSSLIALGIHGQLAWMCTGVLFIALLIGLVGISWFRVAPSHVLNDCVKSPLSATFERMLNSPLLFLGVIAFFIVLLRLPNLVLGELNPDESQWMAGAATLLQDHRFWISVDGTTSGPLVICPLILINLFGGSINYCTARLFGLIFCIIPTIVFLYFSFKTLFNDAIARLVTAPMAACFALLNTIDLVAYNSEHVPMLLISACLFLLTKTLVSTAYQAGWGFLLGITLGVVPFSKIQAAPIAASIALCCGMYVAYAIVRHRPKTILPTVLLISGSILPSIIILLYLVETGALSDFWQSYIVSNLLYANNGVAWGKVQLPGFLILPRLIISAHDTRLFFTTQLVVSITGLLWVWRNRKAISSSGIVLFVTAICTVLSSYLSIIKPGCFFQHYQILFFVPALFFFGTITGLVFSASQQTKRPWLISGSKTMAAVIVFLCVAVPGLYSISQQSLGIASIATHRHCAEKSPVAIKISGFVPAGNRMALWGWLSSLYIETSLYQGTREAHSYHQQYEDAQQDYYLRRYVQDLTVNKPAVFCDVVGTNPTWYNPEAKRHEQYAPIREIIDQRYSLAAEIGDARIYLLKDAKKP